MLFEACKVPSDDQKRPIDNSDKKAFQPRFELGSSDRQSEILTTRLLKLHIDFTISINLTNLQFIPNIIISSPSILQLIKV